MTDGYKIKRVLIWQNNVEKQIYPAGWKPGENTIAYFPLENNSNEGSGKSVSTSDYSVNFSTVGGVKCANTASSNGRINVSTSIFDGSSAWTEQTMSFWLYLNALPGTSGYSNWAFEFEKYGYYSFYFLARSNNVYRYEGVDNGSTIDVNIPSTDVGKWNYFTLVSSASGKYMYKNGVQIGSGTGSSRPRGNRPNNYQENMVILNSRAYDGRVNGGLRELIFEKKCRTAQEISAYYNLTKGNYGL